ncbi:MAG: isoprenylcysteine carboxylmethyltransferase family protein [Acidobacteriota bacterium]|nr:isoprenylcysteine carboxylmethyltransferase family protein [Acidobacteriota bacterium]
MTIVQRIRVPTGIIFSLIFVYFSSPQPYPLMMGLGLTSLGLVMRIWAAGHIEKGIRLASCGPYQWTRNPLYFGSFLIGLGFSLASSKAWLVVVFLLLFLALYIPVMRREEKELEQSFGSAYMSYRRKVPLFLPRFQNKNPTLDPIPIRSTYTFRWHLVILNREYNAVVGCILIAMILWLKTLQT